MKQNHATAAIIIRHLCTILTQNLRITKHRMWISRENDWQKRRAAVRNGTRLWLLNGLGRNRVEKLFI